jgi:hypothetical protein
MMTIEQKSNEIIFKVSGDLDIDILQDISDLLEYKELTKQSKATQNSVDALVKTIKKGRWKKTKEKLAL